MARQAKLDQQDRSVEVDRKKLIETLVNNKEKHVAAYQSAMQGYKDRLKSKIDEAFADAREKLNKEYDRQKVRAEELSEKDIKNQHDTLTLVQAITVTMPVPRCYDKEYDAAIDIAKWDVRDTLELSHAEFTCFVRDEWDWKREFATVSGLYVG